MKRWAFLLLGLLVFSFGCSTLPPCDCDDTFEVPSDPDEPPPLKDRETRKARKVKKDVAFATPMGSALAFGAKLNTSSATETGRIIDLSFTMFPPFSSDCPKR